MSEAPGISCCYCKGAHLDLQGDYSSRTERSTGSWYKCSDCKKLVCIPYGSTESRPMIKEGYVGRKPQ